MHKSITKIDRWFGLFLLLPSIVIICFMFLYLLGYSGYISFTNLTLKRGWNAMEFVGLQQYMRAFTNPTFWKITGQTFFFISGAITGVVLLSTGMALLLNEPFKGRAIVVALFLISWVLPRTATTFIWSWMFDGQFGIVNYILMSLGIISSPRVWLMHANSAMGILILTYIWRQIPFATLIILAGLQGIPKQLYEVARIDGASTLRQFISITLPLVKRVMLIILVLQTIASFKAFTLVYTLTQGAPRGKTELLITYIFKQVFEYLNFGYGSAVGYILITVFILPLSIIYLLVYIGKE